MLKKSATFSEHFDSDQQTGAKNSKKVKNEIANKKLTDYMKNKKDEHDQTEWFYQYTKV